MLPGFWDPGCHACILIDLVNTALASKDSAENKCMISEGYKAHRGVTGPMNFKKSGRFFFFPENHAPGVFGAPGCHPGTLIDLANVALDSRDFVETIFMIWEGCRTHSVVTGPMNFKKSGRFFFRKIMPPGFWGTWLPSRHFN